MVVLLALARLALERDYYSDALAMSIVFVWLLYIPLWTVIMVALTATVALWGERRTSGWLATGLRWTGNALGWTSAVFGVAAACFVALSITAVAFM